MGTSDRLYEVACEARDLETKYDRLAVEVSHLREELGAVTRAGCEAVEAVRDARLAGAMPPLPDEVASSLAALESLVE